MKPVNLSDIDRRLAARIDAPQLGGLNALKLALAPKIGLELGEDPQHVEKRLAGGCGRIDRLLGCAQGDATKLQIMNDILQILHRSGESVDARDHQGVTWSKEFEKDGKFGSSITARTTFFLGADHGASGSSQGTVLDREVLISRADPGVAVK